MSDIYVVGNWKMNGSVALAQEFSGRFKAIGSELSDQIAVAICFPDLLINAINPKSGIRVGAQNLSEHNAGAYTGETSAQLLKDQSLSLIHI